ncbi:metallophosphoesterase [Empedobacter falsenii]|uniref:metallophosphoesterase family protein n=1 Tax=Empedobacter falsenii TaxID=343874 RepID=UPI0025782E4A|nr:metallophosphoesterase [Empedobacter falsenii]MDM1298317.1 metallophosphoesterase [Empedobacter falsenii]MDM1318126.1 metallophosphoesterase [Empedobacter falsenii]
MKIALFSDIHGKILLPFKLVDLFQKETGQKIDFILQCGDMGAYPTLENLDKATLKHAKADRDELGFFDDFTTINPEIKTFLDQLNIDMICVRGNHEDHDFLDDLEQKYPVENRFPIDAYKRVFVCKSGKKQTLIKDQETLSFIGIGRIGDRKNRSEQRFIQEYEKKEVKKLIKSNEQFDVLITHDKDDGSQRGYGMAEIRNVLDELIFHYHFYGHTGQPFHQELDVNGITQSVKIKELEFNNGGVLEQGSMIILTKENDDISIEIVPLKMTNQLTKFNWKLA